MVALALIGLVPLLLGLLFELVVVVPLRVPLDQTPLFFPWQVSAHREVRSQPFAASSDVYVSSLGLGSGSASYEDHLCGDHDGTKLVAQESTGTGRSCLMYCT